MKILKEGKLPSEEEYQGCCKNCGTVVSFKKNEATFMPSQKDGDSLKINCPLFGCGNKIWVSV